MWTKILMVGLVVAAGGAARAQEDDLGARLKALLESKAASVVTIRAVIKTEFMGREREMRDEVQGVVVDKSGLIMASSRTLSPTMGDDDHEFKVTPVELKVIIGNEEKEYDAVLAAKDSKVGLCFLQIRDLGDRELPTVDLTSPRKAEIGERVVVVSRMTKGYDYAPYYRISRINGAIRKPRKAYSVERTGELGLPVFALDGAVIGVNAQVESGLKDDGEPSMMAFFTRGGGGRPFVLPAKVVAALVKQALRRAAEMLEEEKKRETSGETPEDGKSGEDG